MSTIFLLTLEGLAEQKLICSVLSFLLYLYLLASMFLRIAVRRGWGGTDSSAYCQVHVSALFSCELWAVTSLSLTGPHFIISEVGVTTVPTSLGSRATVSLVVTCLEEPWLTAHALCECSALDSSAFCPLIPQSSLLPARAYLRVSQTQSADTCAERIRDSMGGKGAEGAPAACSFPAFLQCGGRQWQDSPQKVRKHGLPGLRWRGCSRGRIVEGFPRAWNKYHKVGDLTPETYCLIILEAGSLRTRYGQGWLPLRSVRALLHASPTFCDLLAVFRALWLMGASPPRPFHHAHMAFSLHVHQFPLLIRLLVMLD